MFKNYKIVLSALLLFSIKSFHAQVAWYSFTQYQGSYSAITGGTVFATSTTDDGAFVNPASPGTNLTTGPGIPIGFPFTFNNTPYDVFGIDNNGWIAFGQSTLTPNPVNLNNTGLGLGLSGASTAPPVLQNRVAGLGRDLVSNSGSLRVQTIGTTPSRTCVIQWASYRSFGSTGDNINFQIRLLETSNIVQVGYGVFTVNSNNSGQVGLRGYTNADFNNRIVNTANTWSASIPGTANTSVADWNTSGLVPSNGQVYEWTPPPPCNVPAGANALATFTNVCPGASVNLSLSTTYTNYGITYQWQSSSTGTNGTFSNITGTVPAISTGSLGTTMAYRAVITCTTSANVINSVPVLITVGAPVTTSAIASPSLICPGANGTLSLGANYGGLGVGYQWQSSTNSGLGPFTNVTGTTSATSGTLPTLISPSVTVNTYYQAILSCTANPSFSVATSAATITLEGVTTSVVPYLETFEGIQVNNKLPNCSWAGSNWPTVNQTYTIASTFNRIPNSGQKFASFRSNTNPNGDYFYTNGIQLNAGVTYSASVAYITDGLLGWSEFSLLYGSSQSTTGLTSIASVTGAVTGTSYKWLSNTFTVATSGLYYVAVKAIGNSTPQFLSFDDLSIIIPCELNDPHLEITANNTVLCQDEEFTMNAVGADSYTWSTGENTASLTTNAGSGGTNIYVVTGSSTLTGCNATATIAIQLKPSPPVSVFANNPVVCSGQPVNISAFGAASYVWSGNGGQGNFITINPASNVTYSVTGFHANGCSRTATIAIAVNPLPTVGVTSDVNAEICAGETVNLTGNGALTYQWTWNTNLSNSGVLTVNPLSTTVYSVVGTDNKGCQSSATFAQNVSACAGLGMYLLEGNQLGFFPNPATDKIRLVSTFKANITVVIYDISGRRVFENLEMAPGAEISLTDLPSAIYYIQLESEGVVNTLKLVKQ